MNPSTAIAAEEDDGAGLPAQGFTAVLVLPLPDLPVSHRTAPFVRPIIMVLGLAAAGRAGKASAADEDAAAFFRNVDVAAGAEGVSAGEALDEEGVADAQGVVDVAAERDEEAGSDGNELALDAAMPARELDDDGITRPLPQLPCLLTADRLDCAVELFNLRTRLPPVPASAAEEPGKTPPGPGRTG